MKSFYDKHHNFIEWCYRVTFGLGLIWAFFHWLDILFQTAQAGSILGFVFILMFQSLIMMVNALLTAIVWGTIAVIVLFIPYLVVRGLTK